MVKNELVELGKMIFATEVNGVETKASKKLVEEKLSEIDKLIEGYIANGELGKTKISKYITLELVDVPEKSGVCNGKEFVTEAHRELLVKRTSLAKRV